MYGPPGLPPPPPPRSNAGLVIGIVIGALVLIAGVCVAGVVGVIVVRDKAKDRSPVSASTRDPYSGGDYTAPAAAPTTKAPAPPPAPARVGECISVDEIGTYLGTGSCNGTKGAYKVLTVDYSRDTCPDPESPYITEDGYRLCLEVYLVRTYCYKFPSGSGWVVPASACKAKGTVHIIDIVPGATNSNNCTRDYKWNRWYQFSHPTVVYCVMQY
ncbi:hypothetical protein GCM10010532_069330 [Dactylosporangium siamense]|uniref:Uncharacterized protein n=2 Tax=Dactylosporangium siamense TaxID=685454 RepID=A0A919PL69_9ACTN|nr:hypothetical protein Dsi01nite_047670 [Dactylosporangium siamense]